MNILIVEDDYMQSDTMASQLSKALNPAIVILNTEYEFYNYITEIEKNPPDVIILDIMLIWAKPSPNIPQSPERVIREGTVNAGFRCREKLSENPKTKNIPVILFSVLEKYDLKGKLSTLPSNVIHIPKGREFTVLISQIEKITKQSKS